MAPWIPANAGANLALHPERLQVPLHWRKPRRVFVCSMADLFHEQVPYAFITAVLDVIGSAQRHTFQVLTKRPDRMAAALTAYYDSQFRMRRTEAPFPNLWLGVSAENQRWADARIPLLLQTPAARRFVSCEPLLGEIDLTPWLRCEHWAESGTGKSGVWRCDTCGEIRREVDDPEGPVSAGSGRRFRYETLTAGHLLDWVIVGGESGPTRRRMDLRWACWLREQCRAAGVAYFGKQDAGLRPGIPLPGSLGDQEWPK